MSTVTVRTTLVAMTLVVAASTVTPAMAGGAPKPTPKPTRVFGNCESPQYKPATLILACADDNAGITKATYTHWWPKKATGSGTFTYNDCNPYCAAGHDHSKKANFLLYDVVKTKKYGALFSRIKVTTKSGSQTYYFPTSKG